MIKAIFFDIDGTLIPFGEKNIPTKVVNALTLLRLQGIKLYISTGRHPQLLAPIRQIFEFDGYITLNGQYAWIDQKVLRSQPISPSELSKFLAYLEEHPFPCVFLEINQIYANYVEEKIKLFTQLQDLPLPPVCPLPNPNQNQVFQVIAFLSKEEETPLIESVSDSDFVRWSPLFVDTVAKGGGKEHGIQAFCDEIGITAEEVMAFGDGENDITMLQYAGIGVAMGNASQPVFDVADFITKDVDDDGIYHALTHFNILE